MTGFDHHFSLNNAVPQATSRASTGWNRGRINVTAALAHGDTTLGQLIVLSSILVAPGIFNWLWRLASLLVGSIALALHWIVTSIIPVSNTSCSNVAAAMIRMPPFGPGCLVSTLVPQAIQGSTAVLCQCNLSPFPVDKNRRDFTILLKWST
ncbi:hypothetical protein B0J12DRAFT_347588 [Macrophomina phaseolina]|uniref:Uncharacterized protein n=1 Tax=Macrophomina phaseolina TaxID=35725 RepID=A0ABQ8GMJ3_9PEZI|nr:hypothetical protein B0J12DRAFT_347588 [Macrophomina phaseolina]